MNTGVASRPSLRCSLLSLSSQALSYGSSLVPPRVPLPPVSGRFGASLALLPGMLLAGLSVTSAQAGLSEFTWGDVLPVGALVEEVGGSGGRSAEYDFLGDGRWHLVYVRGGDVQIALGGELGWSELGAVSPDPAASRAPSIASTGDWLHVVWEDERSGHPEVWTQRFDGVAWTEAECLSCDALPSRRPAFDGSELGLGVVAWEDEAGDGGRSVRVRTFDDDDEFWAEAQTMSAVSSNATEPAVAVGSAAGGAVVVWVDDRHGAGEIYGRGQATGSFSGDWQDEERATDLPGACRRPRVVADYCCYDTPDILAFVVFEQVEDDVVESWAVIGGASWIGWDDPPFRLSQLDGVPSTAPAVGGVQFGAFSCYGSNSNLSFASWTDAGPGDGTQQLGRYVGSEGDLDDPLALGSLLGSGVAGRTRSPNAPVLQFWLTAEGTLSAREGHELNCWVETLEFAPYFYAAPAGGTNEVRLLETCRDLPVANNQLEVEFYNGMETQFAVDPFQETRIFLQTDEQGRATWVFRGGGCVREGEADGGVILVGCPWYPTYGAYGYYISVKSPDIDGTCSVEAWDLAYVEERVGTDDFCADLDGSGLVDALDVALVSAALGDACERTAGVPDGDLGEDPGDGSDGAGGDLGQDGVTGRAQLGGLRVVPNPGADRFALAFGLEAGDRAVVRVIDVSGRMVREVASVGPAPTEFVAVEWDGRDAAGNPVPAGVYFAEVRREADARVERARIVVAR